MSAYMASLSSSFTNFRSASSWFEVYAAFSTLMMLLRTAVNDIVPEKLRSSIAKKLESFFFPTHKPNNLVSIRINQRWDGHHGEHNELYNAASKYLPTRISETYKALRLAKLNSHKGLMLAIDANQEVIDEFEGIRYTWTLDLGSDQNADSSKSDKDPAFVLTFNEKHRDTVMKRYIPHLLATCEAMDAADKSIKIFSMAHGYWNESELCHPATLDTLALDPELKRTIVDDVDRFLKRKEFYMKVGKPWKRGYLLYGPPGTGKSSLIAAIANYLKFNVYDLELDSITSNESLMLLMRSTTSRSIIVIEDIDCNKEVHVRRREQEDFGDTDLESVQHDDAAPEIIKVDKFTLSALLNYMDGLWSGYGEERIIIFTTNHKDKIDPALLRPGRMDMHIHLSFLRAKAFRILASNYLDIPGDQPHPLFQEIEDLLDTTDVTPAVVAEQLIRSEDPDVALDGLFKFLQEIHNSGKSRDSAETLEI
ncbi:hypothetical protein HN51_068666 [Arachis hypogaea]|uniref:AAA+ ATPase domain-containing protein n=1 Tax=Arachis hypogaea TaxID=3818 RepID=A0A444Z9F5_ARAHY|nr:AAA-ATPase At2g18193-like [Arachis ipaensis]XP_025653518.1 AAA-ATPase At2g18193 [Arachis hypogaea]QHO10766.1 AAA-ATPase [Arachis hypogaea]RYR10806.1 hypothetical protein Ahy_B05g079290 [Arachis hypogaea]